MVLGELIYILLEDHLFYSLLLVVIVIISEIVSYIFSKKNPEILKNLIPRIKGNKTVQKKCSELLLFLFLMDLFMILGFAWGYGYYGEIRENEKKLLEAYTEGGRENSGSLENIYISSMDAYVERVEKLTNSTRITMKTSAGEMIMYVKPEEVEEAGEVETGYYIRLKGSVDKLSSATNPGSMDMEKYYSGKGIHFLFNPDYMEIRRDKKNYIANFLFRIRRLLRNNLELWFEEDEASLLSTMLLGDKSGLSSDTKLTFQRSGIAHILAISGLHVALLAGIFESLLKRLKVRKQLAMFMVIGFVFLYGLMTGFSEATFRAVLMLSLSRVAFIFKRSTDMPTSMMEALLIIALIRPDSLMAVGMWMSFMAVVGVVTGDTIYKMTYGNNGFDNLPKWIKWMARGWLNGLYISISINLWMMPLIIYSNYEVPVLALFLNMLVIPILTVLVVCGLVVALFGGLVYLKWILALFVLMCRLIVAFYKFLCQIFLSIPGSVVVTGHVEGWQLLIIYGLIGVLFIVIYLLLLRSNGRLKISVIIDGLVRGSKVGKIWTRIKVRLNGRSVEKSFRRRTKERQNSGKQGRMDWKADVGVSNEKNRMVDGEESNEKNRKVDGEESNEKNRMVGGEKSNEKNRMVGGEESNEKNRKVGGEAGEKIWGVDEITRRRFKYTSLFIASCLIVFVIILVGVRTSNLMASRIVFLDVGQGDASIIHLKKGLLGDGRNYIMDCGSTSSDEIGRYTLIPALKYYAITDIDCAFISHTDTDHVSGIIFLLENGHKYGIKVKHVAIASGTEMDDNLSRVYKAIYGEDDYKEEGQVGDDYEEEGHVGDDYEEEGQMGDDYEEEGRRLEDLMVDDRVIELCQGDIVDGIWEVIYPSLNEEREHSGNDYSLVMKLSLKELDILYTGDIGSEVEYEIVDKGLLSGEKDESNGEKMGILKCPHHGSKYSNSEEFLEEYNPDITIISVASKNSYGHPHQETLDRLEETGCEIYRTDVNGAVIIHITDKNVEIKDFVGQGSD